MRLAGISIALSALLGLGGCLDFGSTSAAVNPQWFQASAPRMAVLDDGALRVAGPAGYCVNPASVAEPGSTTAVLASCAALANSVHAGPSVAPAMIVVSLSDPAQPIAALDAPARLALVQSMTGQSASVTRADTTGSVIMVELADAGLPARSGLAPAHARAMFDQAGRIVSVAAYGIAGTRWNATQSQRLVAQTVAALQAANGGAVPVSEMSPNG